jgi:hypothetical protein
MWTPPTRPRRVTKPVTVRVFHRSTPAIVHWKSSRTIQIMPSLSSLSSTSVFVSLIVNVILLSTTREVSSLANIAGVHKQALSPDFVSWSMCRITLCIIMTTYITCYSAPRQQEVEAHIHLSRPWRVLHLLILERQQKMTVVAEAVSCRVCSAD